MKKLLIAYVLVSYGTLLFAQQHKPISQIIRKDTINLRGYIYNALGKPVPYLQIESRQLDLETDNYHLGATTDTSGYFQINGAKPNDTLKTAKNVFYDPISYYNKGSRFVVIYLTTQKILDITPMNPVVISHQRVSPKKIPSFKPTLSDAEVLYTEVHEYPKFHHGNADFIDFINRKVHYPDRAVNDNIEGTVRVSFTVERDGSMVNYKLLNGIGYGCDEEVINVLKTAGHWTPAIENGRPVAMTETISVEFKLTDKQR